MRWAFYQSDVHPTFWVGTLRVPNGAPRIFINDDFGNAVEVPVEQCRHSLAPVGE
jgi:hypothetical protein